MPGSSRAEDLPRFGRRFFESAETATAIGAGGVGGKAQGLLSARELLASGFGAGRWPDLRVEVPTFTVIGTDVFDAFMQRNRLQDLALSEDSERRIAAAFLRADFPAEMVGDLWALAARVHTPLAVRSSSLLEDALAHPFAGVYATKMTPNNAFDPETRFRRLIEAVKFVYASTYFPAARGYLKATGRTSREEGMAVVVQEVVGRRHGPRFYPDVSGVARSYNFYPSGAARPADGVISLALGLGKTIVDGGRCWMFSPAHPRTAPPYATLDELIDQTQRDFWAVNMGRPPAYDPTAEEEYLVRGDLADAESDGVLALFASSYDPRSDRLAPGIGGPGLRILNFAPLLAYEEPPLTAAVRTLLALFEEASGGGVEIELALTLPVERGLPARLGFLQVRPMAVAGGRVDLTSEDLADPRAVVASERVLGNGAIEDVRDVVFVKPRGFEARHTRTIARELEPLNRRLLEEGRPYLLIGFGRWGSSDPWLGIPVGWGDISGARVLVEATLPAMNVELSQGAHFFHNLISFGVPYFCVAHTAARGIDWTWIESQPALAETDFVRHVRLPTPLLVKVDGRSGCGVILRGEP